MNKQRIVYSLQYLKCLERCRDQGWIDQTSPVLQGELKCAPDEEEERRVKHTLHLHLQTALISSPVTARRGEREREMFPLFA